MKWEEKSIVIHNWPKLIETNDKRWKRTWAIVLKKCIKTSVLIADLERQISTHENKVTIKIEGKQKIMMEVVTERWGWEDDLYFYSYNLLKHVNDVLGEIFLIQGQERDLWDPWLSERLND